jgi:hypothetical protein
LRQCITKGAFAELRAVCVKQGSPLTGDFLDLEREIDSFAGQYADRLSLSVGARDYPIGKARRSVGQLALIEGKATALRARLFWLDVAGQGRTRWHSW